MFAVASLRRTFIAVTCAVAGFLAAAGGARAATYSVNFEDGSKSSYASGDVALNGITWNMTDALIGDLAADFKNGLKSARLRGYTASAITMVGDKADGAGDVSFSYRAYGTDAQVPWRVEYSTDAGGNWTQVGADFTPDGTARTFTSSVNAAGNVRIRIRAVNTGTSNKRANVDDILISDFGAAVSNRPATLAAIGNKNVGEGSTLAFLVTGTDPDGTDTVTVWPTNVPAGASFAPTTAAGTASNVFNWASASPDGSYPITFFAEDKDGTNSEVVTINVIAENTDPDLLISEYGEGSSNNKYLELFNGTGADIDLSAYSIKKQVNGAGAFGSDLALSGILANNDTFVIVYSSAAPELLALADLQTGSQSMSFNGNDAVALYKGANPLDVVGVIDGGSGNIWGADLGLVRKSGVTVPKTTWAPTEWDTIVMDVWTDVGLHSFDGGSSNRPPTFTSIADQTLTINADLAFLVQARDPDGADAVSLWATNLPAGATFAATNGIGSVSNVFAWVGATPQGDFPVTFYAADKDGTNSLSLTIQVVPPGIASDLILSEYCEGSGFNKAIELFNGTGRSLNLADYSLRIYRSQTNTPSDTLALSGTIGHANTYVIVNGSALDPVLLAQADRLTPNSGVMQFNGDDAIGLFKGGVLLDIVGPFFAGVWGQDKGFVRNNNVFVPTNEYDALQWTEYPNGTYGDVGLHNMIGLGNQPPAIAAESPNVYGYEGRPLSFTVSASDATDGDQITLLGAGLPIGSQFPTVVGQTSVQGTFTWNNPFPAGTYYPLFQAIDKDGTNTQQVTLRIYLPLSSNQTLVAHFNEVEADQPGDDTGEFVELIGHAGVDLAGCSLVHLNGSETADGGIWSFTFPATTNSIFPDDGIIDTNGIACGFIVLAQPGGTLATNCDFLMPVDPGATNTNVLKTCLQGGPDGLVLYDPAFNVLDAVSWSDDSAFPERSGDILIDDPGAGVLSRTIPSSWAPFLHYARDDRDGSGQAPNDVIGDTGAHWEALNPTSHALNAAQVNGAFILLPQVPPPPLPPSGLMLLVW